MAFVSSLDSDDTKLVPGMVLGARPSKRVLICFGCDLGLELSAVFFASRNWEGSVIDSMHHC